MIRASNNDCECRDDSLQTRSDTHSAARNRQEQHDMRHVRNPVGEKRCDAPKRCPPADNDSDTGRQRHRHRPMRMNRGKQKSPGESRREEANKQLFFLPPTADFLNGQRPLFLPLRRMASCGAWRWGWWRRHGGKLVFRQSAPPATPRRSRHPPPRLFVFMSSPYRRNKWRMRHATRPF